MQPLLALPQEQALLCGAKNKPDEPISGIRLSDRLHRKVDGMTFARIEEQGLEAWLAGLRAELVSKTYRPDPVRRGGDTLDLKEAKALLKSLTA